MKKNGFTLIELLVVIALIGALGVVVGVGVFSMLDRQNEKNYNDFVNELEQGACTLVDLSTFNDNCKNTASGCSITSQTLISEGLVSKELLNPKTKAVINGSEIIKITWENGEKTCSLTNK